MARPKGIPKTGGRRSGTKNKASAERASRAAASGMMPHDFLLAVSRGEIIDDHTPTFAERLDAAAKAAPYYAAKLATVAHTGPDGGSIIVEIKNF